MTTADFESSTGEEMGRPEAPSGPGAEPEGPSSDTLPYDVFLSYSRADLEIADKMERDLETFPLPRSVRKRLGHRHLNVFRDISDMTGNRLESGIEQKLEQSRTLVVLCSPATRRWLRGRPRLQTTAPRRSQEGRPWRAVGG